MKSVTRTIDPESARDLLERVPRACISFIHEDGPQAQPAALVWRDNRYRVGLPETEKRQPNSGQEAVLLVDEGVHFYDLRAIYIRGHLRTVEAPTDAKAGYVWFEVDPILTVAWDYGTLHEGNDER